MTVSKQSQDGTGFIMAGPAVSYGILKHRHARGYITVVNGTHVDIGLFTRYDSRNYILKFNTFYAERSTRLCTCLYICILHTGWRTKRHTIDCIHNTFLLLQKHLTPGTELILIGWKIVPNEEHVQCDSKGCQEM